MQWDAHKDIDENHKRMAGQTDRPVAALLTDLKRRGLLDTTLVRSVLVPALVLDLGKRIWWPSRALRESRLLRR